MKAMQKKLVDQHTFQDEKIVDEMNANNTGFFNLLKTNPLAILGVAGATYCLGKGFGELNSGGKTNTK